MSSDPMSMGDMSQFTGPILLGHLFNWALYGILCVQCYLYYISFPKDRRLPKSLVWITLLLETLQLILSTRDAWMNLASGWGNMQALDNVGWQWFSLPILIVLPASANLSMLGGFGLSVARSGFRAAATYVAAITAIHLRYSLIRDTTYRPIIIWFVTSAACDLLIAVSTFYFLKRKKAHFKPTETTITRIIRVTVETGLICAACAILELAMFLAFANNTFYMPLCLSLSKLYSNSLLAVLNSRLRIVGSRDETLAVYDSTLSPCPPPPEAAATPPAAHRATVTVKTEKRTSQDIVLVCQESTASDSSTGLNLKAQDLV
ncbi:hypothetical protein NLI96_g8912 [Meripilus lineatus]|uniref:DUF6534 domain-containing protein n=1 Tax=Meripilus lineatus TaxID=2056292 RepID=A0AAD5YAR7_9APHY|nr:hypothetical protein NLI96_g8912 [Physisporinus lineatus]